MFCILIKEKIYPAYVSKPSSNRQKQVILLMIQNGERCVRSKTLATGAKSEGRWHYLAIKETIGIIKRNNV